MRHGDIFHFAISELPEHYRIRVLESPLGGALEEIPRQQIDRDLRELFSDLVGLVEAKATLVRLPAKQDIERFGQWLFDTFFVGKVRRAWEMSLQNAGPSPLALRLQLYEVPSLSRLPWEALFASNRFVALNDETPVHRSSRVETKSRSGELRGRIRLLFLGRPLKHLPFLAIDSEWKRVTRALSKATWRLRFILQRDDAPSLNGLPGLGQPKIQILHFAGHGIFDLEERQGFTFAESADGEVIPHSAHDWSTAVSRQPDLRLVVFNSCDGARHIATSGAASLAHSVADLGIPAVVGMQFPITDQAALVFSEVFYKSLAEGKRIDVAVTRARRAIQDVSQDEWISPVLYLREIPADSSVGPRDFLVEVWRKMTLHPLRTAMAGLLFVLGVTVWSHRTTVAERGWRALREANAAPYNPVATDPSYDPNLSCPSPPGLNLEFVQIPAGSFTMGWSRGKKEERPPHDVRLSDPFCFGLTEVTQAQWKAVMRDNPSSTQRDDLPVNNVSWLKAQEFVAKLNDRETSHPFSLPTEAQWEFVGRAGSTRRYGFPGGEADLPSYGNCGGVLDGFRGLAPVKEFEKNSWGIFGMYGNVSEWVLDWTSDYPSSAIGDPRGPSYGKLKVRRGGSLRTNAESCSATSRFASEPTYKQYDVGFRIVRTPVRRAVPSSR